MAYLGRGLDRGNYLKLDDLQPQFNGSTTTFNLTSGGQAFYPGSSFSLIVSLAGVIQEPESAFTIDQNQITFANAPGATESFFCLVLGVPLAVGVPAQGSVTSNIISNGSVTFEKLDPDARGVGIQSGGVSIAGAGVTQLNFVGTGNTFVYNSSTKTVDISIEGGGGGGAGGVAGITTAVGFGTEVLVGINSHQVVGSAHSEGALQVNGNVAIVEGALLTHKTIDGQVNIPANKNGLLIGPVSVGTAATIDVAPGSVLVIV